MTRPSGLKGFATITMGQVASITGTAMTQFGLSYWVWQEFGRATPFSIMSILFFGAQVIFGLAAGSLVDRWPRKISLILPDIASGVLTLIALFLYTQNALTLSFLYTMSFVNGIFSALQWPAYSVTLASMLKPDQYTKANALFSITDYGPALVAPILAGGLLGTIGLEGIMTIDLLTLTLAVFINLWVFIPDIRKKETTGKVDASAGFWQDILFGFKFISQRKPLLMLLMVFLASNFFAGFGNSLFSPCVLARTNNNALALGTIETFFGVGGLIGTLLLSLWVLPGRKVTALLIGLIISDVGFLILGYFRWIPTMCIGATLGSFGGVMANTHSQAIWQSIVPITMQGRVFSARRFIAQALSGIPMFLSGPLVDNVLVPYFNQKTMLSNVLGQGPAGAISFLMILGSILSIAVALLAFANYNVQHVEDLAMASLEADSTQETMSTLP